MARLPPGFRFHPTDVELIMYYLKRKITGKKLHFEGITELNIYKFSPWDLPDKCCYKSKDLEWYFFCPRERKYASGGRMNRATDTGYWKTTGKDRPVTYDEKIVGSVKTLVFHLGHPPRGQRTDWVIHEYKFEDKESIDAGFAQDSYVLCKVFQKSGPGPKNGAQYGAPFKEEDWEDDKIPAEPCTSDVFPAPPGRPDKPSDSNATRMVDPGSSSVWPSSELSPSPIQPSVQKLPLDEPDDEELPGEPKLSNVSSINWMPSDQLKAISSNIFSALPILPKKQSCSVDTSLVNPGPGPSNDQMCTNEMALDELDDEMIGLFTQFTDDTSLLSGGNETNQKLENFHQDVNAPPAAFTDGNDIFDGLGDIEFWARVGQLEPDLTASSGANYSLNPVILPQEAPQDAAYMELNDLDIPLNQPAETIGTGQLVPGHFCTPYNSNIGMQQLCFGSNSLGIVQDFGEHHLPTLPESYTQQVNHPDMAYNFQNNANQGYNAATNFSVSSYKQPEESRLDTQNLERGVQQRKFYLSIFALCDGSFLLVKAEVTFGVDGCTDDALSVVLGEQRKLYSSIFTLCSGSFILVKAEVTLGVDECTNDALSVILGEQRKLYLSIFALCGGSFILVKAEVTLGVDGCTNDALSVILGNPFFSFTRVSNIDKADFSKKTHEAFCSGFSLAFICFSHVELLWFNSLWELYQFIVFKILLNQLKLNSSGTPFHAASASADFSAKLWDALTGDVLHSFDHKHIVRACAFSEDTNLLLTGGFEKILRIFDLNRPDAPPREIDSSPGSVRTVAWLHSDQTILSSSGDAGGLRLWDVRSGKVVQILETKFPVTSAEVSQDGRYITTADGSSVKFWDANHFGLVKSHDLPCKVESASLEPKFGNRFIAGGEDMWVHVFDFHTGEEIGCNKGHHGPVHCLRFSPGGESYASGSEDGTIRIWQLGPLGQIEDNSTANGSTTANANDGMSEVTQKIDELAVSETKKMEETQVDGVEQKVVDA